MAASRHRKAVLGHIVGPRCEAVGKLVAQEVRICAYSQSPVSFRWLLQILMALAFTLVGVAKFADPSWARNFARWGYPDGFYMVIGGLELIGDLAQFVPRLTTYAAGLLGIIMIGASLTHWINGESARVLPPLMYVAALIVVGLLRWPAAWRVRATGAAAIPAQPS